MNILKHMSDAGNCEVLLDLNGTEVNEVMKCKYLQYKILFKIAEMLCIAPIRR